MKGRTRGKRRRPEPPPNVTPDLIRGPPSYSAAGRRWMPDQVRHDEWTSVRVAAAFLVDEGGAAVRGDAHDVELVGVAHLRAVDGGQLMRLRAVVQRGLQPPHRVRRLGGDLIGDGAGR